MIGSELTTHAARRLQQRAIPGFVVELLESFGTASRCGDAEKLLFDNAARKRLKQHLGGDRNMKIIEPWLGVYMVLGDNGRCVTVAHQTRRRRH